MNEKNPQKTLPREAIWGRVTSLSSLGEGVTDRVSSCTKCRPARNALFPKLLTALFLSSSLLSCAEESKAAEPIAANPKPVLERTAVQVVTTTEGVLSTSRSISATLNAVTDASVVAEASGRVLKILKRAGAFVQAGETILLLESAQTQNSLEDARLALSSAQVALRSAERQNPEDTSQARLRLSSSQSAVDTAARLAAANQKIYALGGVSLVELQNSQSALRNAQADLEAARAALARTARASSEGLEGQRIAVAQAQNRVVQLQADVARASVKAPFAGEIAEVFVETGEFASAGTKVLRLIDPSSLKLVFQVPASDADLLKAGTPLSALVQGKRIAAKVSEDARVPSENRLVRLRGRILPNQNLALLKLGTTIRLEYNLRLAKGVLLPSAALRAEGQNYFVYLVKNNIAGRAAVRVLSESAGRVAVTGIPSGASVVFPVPAALEPGAVVSVVKP
jgi:HlyD family secretion protein